MPRPGRPRDASIDDVVVGTVIELLGEVGIGGLSMELVAKRAGVGKATIYRRWSSKEALVVDALSSKPPFPVPDTGSLRGDLADYVKALVEITKAVQGNDVLPHLIAAASYDDRLAESLHEFMRLRQKVLRSILRSAVNRGELSADLEPDMLVDLLLGSYFYRRIVTGEPITERALLRLIDFVLEAARVADSSIS